MNVPTSEDLGKKIREAREEAGLSQQELGAKLNPPRSHAAVSDMERGVTRVGATDVAQIARIIGRPTSYFYGEEEPHRSTSGLHARGDPQPADIDSFRKRVDDLLKRQREEE